jgi:hypothetical protein
MSFVTNATRKTMTQNRPRYTDPNSTQTVQQGLDEFYALYPSLNDPRKLSLEFGKILLAHDVSHVIFGCDTGMYDELKLLPLTWWTSNYKFSDHLRTLKDPKIAPAVAIMYDELIQQHGAAWLYSSILFVLPILLPELIEIWFKTRHRQLEVPFLDFESLLGRSLLDIRQEFDILSFIKENKSDK